MPIHHHPPNLSCCIKIWRDSEAFLVGGHLWVCASAHYDTCLHLLRAVHLCAHFTAQFVDFRCLSCGFHTSFQVRIWTTSVVQLLHINFYVWNEEMHSWIASWAQECLLDAMKECSIHDPWFQDKYINRHPLPCRYNSWKMDPYTDYGLRDWYTEYTYIIDIFLAISTRDSYGETCACAQTERHISDACVYSGMVPIFFILHLIWLRSIVVSYIQFLRILTYVHRVG